MLHLGPLGSLVGLLETEIPVARVTPAARVALVRLVRLALLVQAGILEPQVTPGAQALRVTPEPQAQQERGLLRALRVIPERLVLRVAQGHPAPQAWHPRPSP